MLFRFLVLLLTGVVISGIVVGCGGQGSEAGKKSATGVVKSTDTDNRKLKVKPRDGDPRVFKYNPENIKVTLEGEKAKPGEIEEGQKATVNYVTKNDRDVARSIELEKKKKK